MVMSKPVLECPYCGRTLEIEPPDRLHSAYSFERPLRGSFHGDAIQQRIVCQNSKCKKPIAVYWYAPMDYFNRI